MRLNRLTAVIVVAVLLLSLAVWGLIGQRKQSAPPRAFDRAIAALHERDMVIANRELAFLKEQPGFQRQCELIQSGLLLDRHPEECLRQLRALADHPETAAERGLLIAEALVRLNRAQEAEQQIKTVLDTYPSHPLALKTLQALQKDRSDAERFVSQLKPMVEGFCGDCHATPSPSSFPKAEWAKEVEGGFEFYRLFDRHDLQVPDELLVRKYFELQAPDHLDVSVVADQPVVESSIKFVPGAATPTSPNPGIAHVSWTSLQRDEKPVLLTAEMRYGTIMAFDPKQPQQSMRVLAELDNPCHTTVSDVNQDGHADVLVADLGSFYPKDHRKGRVVCLKSDGQGDYQPVVLLDKVGRVADVQPGDFDGDGDQDLIVAEFGWRTSGRILYLDNISAGSDELKFTVVEIDPRHGTIHVPVIDLNLDGKLDFIALITQEHEKVVAFLGNGQGQFSPVTLYAAEDPSYGSSGIQLVDLDRDGDQDVLYTNGDSFDSDLRKPYHGVQWLENEGELKFTHHRLVNCFGAYRAHAHDFDNDNDLDIVVVMALPIKGLQQQQIAETESIICLVNDGQQNFAKQVIERGNLLHTTCDVGDIDGDGDADLIVGRLNVFDANLELPMVDLWLNESN